MKEFGLLKMFLIVKIFFMIGCSGNNHSEKSIPCIDVRKNYPEKEIILTDIADVSYLHMNTEDDNYLYRGGINYISKNTIIIAGGVSGNILFFSKDGNPKSFFNHYGAGPEEYMMAGQFLTIIYDENADDVFVHAWGGFLVYSSTGVYKRKLTLPPGTQVSSIVDYDDQSLLLHDSKNRYKNPYIQNSDKESLSVSPSNDSSYFFISKADGKALEYIKFPRNEIDFTEPKYNGLITTIHETRRVIKCVGGVLLCNIDSDTVFFYGKDKSIIPIMCKTPLVSDLDPKVVLNNFRETDRYQFIEIKILKTESTNVFDYMKYYIRDKQTGEIFRQKIILPEYQGKEFFRFFSDRYSNENEYYLELDLIELKEAYKENRLSGKLKELVATLNELEDNNVFMSVKFK